MSGRSHELALRREALRAQCAIQRHRLANTASLIETQLGSLDRGINAVRAVVRSPVLVVGAISLVVLLGPRRLLSWIGRGVVLITSARRLTRLAHSSGVLGEATTGAQIEQLSRDERKGGVGGEISS